MIFQFDKILPLGIRFDFQNDGIKFEGELKKIDNNLVKCKARYTGAIQHSCDICGGSLEVELSENLDLIISNKIYKTNDEFNFDVYEVFDGKINLEDIIQSEVKAALSDYFYCEKCKF